jgi:hypothetical protein
MEMLWRQLHNHREKIARGVGIEKSRKDRNRKTGKFYEKNWFCL